MSSKRRGITLSDVFATKTRLTPYGQGSGGGLSGVRRKKTSLLGAPAVQECAPIHPNRRIRVCVIKPEKAGPAVMGPRSACAFLRGAAHGDRESFYAIHLNVQNKVIGLEEIGKGTLDAVMAAPRDVFKGALLTNAASIIVAHNHPSGDPTPSDADMNMTAQLIKAGRVLGIPIRDHVVVGDEGCTSIREMLENQGHDDVFSGARVTRRKKVRRRR